MTEWQEHEHEPQGSDNIHGIKKLQVKRKVKEERKENEKDS